MPGEIIERIAALVEVQREIAQRLGCGWFDAGTVAEPSPVDGVHLDAKNTRSIGVVLAQVVVGMLEGT